jgi:hypothetical protein
LRCLAYYREKSALMKERDGIQTNWAPINEMCRQEGVVVIYLKSISIRVVDQVVGKICGKPDADARQAI